MPWCPNCKSEYKEGMTICPDCECDLVETLEDSLEVESGILSKDERRAIIQFLEKKESMLESEGLEEISESDRLEETVTEKSNEETSSFRGVYQDSASKAEENKSSGLILLVVGFAGMLFLALSFFDVIPFRLSGSTRYMAYGVVGALFVLFIVMGFVSMRSSKAFAKEAETENTLKDAIESWCLNNFNGYKIDVELFGGEDITEEEKYFRRISYMKKNISKQFVNLNEDFLDHYLDEIYTEIFE